MKKTSLKLILYLVPMLSVLPGLCAANKTNKAVFFDLFAVLIDRKNLRARQYIGVGDYLTYAFSGATKNADLEKRYADFLAKAAEDDPVASGQQAWYNGRPICATMLDWLKGLKTSKELIDFLNNYMHEHNDFFLSGTEKKLVTAIISLMRPEVLSSIMGPVKPMIKVIKDCKQEKNGTHNQVFLLTNWDKESFDLLKQQKEHMPMMALFGDDNMILSSEVHMLLPSEELLEYAVKKAGLQPSDCIIITKEKENIPAFEKFGMKTILHTSTGQTRKELAIYGVLS